MLSASRNLSFARVLLSELREDLHEAMPGLRSHNTKSDFLCDSPGKQVLAHIGPTRRTLYHFDSRKMVTEKHHESRMNIPCPWNYKSGGLPSARHTVTESVGIKEPHQRIVSSTLFYLSALTCVHNSFLGKKLSLPIKRRRLDCSYIFSPHMSDPP